MISSSLFAKADVITEKKANFRVNALAIKTINAALSGGDFDVLITQATTIANLARVVPNFFGKQLYRRYQRAGRYFNGF